MTYPGHAVGPQVDPPRGYDTNPSPHSPAGNDPGHPGPQPPAGGYYAPPGPQPPAGEYYAPAGPQPPDHGYYGHLRPELSDRGYYGHLDPAPPPDPRGTRKSRLKAGVRIWFAVVVGGVVMFGVRSFLAGLDDPAVGDCVRATVDSGYELVDCGTAEAQFRVVGEVEGDWTAAEVQADPGLCAAFPAAEVYLWERGYKSESGTVYCGERL
jgi:hypothetical protein